MPLLVIFIHPVFGRNTTR